MAASTKSYINLEGRTFDEPPPGFWYNLATRRRVTKLPAEGYILHDQPRVTGTQVMIKAFLDNNQVQSPDDHELEYHPGTTDVTKIPDHYLNQLVDFTLTGLKVKAKVLHVVDGDTLDLAFFVPAQDLGAVYQSTKGRSKVATPTRRALTFAADVGFFTRMRVRLYGIDTAEKTTHKGKIAKQLLEGWVLDCKMLVYATFLDFDKYGRLLADIFQDAKRTKNVRDHLLDFRHPCLGCVAMPYDGGKKTPWPKTPPRYEEEITRNQPSR